MAEAIKAPVPGEPRLRRAVSTWGSFTWGYADVGADVYVALGLVAGFAQGATPLAFLVTGLVYLCIGFAYTELASTYPVAGGGQYYALRGLGDTMGFVAGWALLLDFTLDVALFGLASAGYLNFFLGQLWPAIKTQPWWAMETIVLIAILVVLNIRGIRESSALNSIFCGLDIFNETFLLLIGFVIAFDPAVLVGQFVRGFPSGYNFAYGASIAIISYIGLESISQAAEETLRPATIVPRTSVALILTVLIYALGFSTLGLGVVPWQTLRDNASDPVAVLASHLPYIGVVAGPFTAILAFTLIYASTNTGVMGFSRITWSMSNFQLLPAWFRAVHPRYRTPVRTIIVFSLVAVAQLIIASLTPSAMDTLANLYAFGAVTGYILVLISLIRLRFRDPHTPRPYRTPWNVRLRRAGRVVDLPMVGVLGVLGNTVIWVIVIVTHELGRIAGPAWMVAGVLLYVWHRRHARLPVWRSVPRDWEADQMRVLTEAQEFESLEKYREALRRRDAHRETLAAPR